jgi:DNA-binding NarL/FixJ family response regulator
VSPQTAARSVYQVVVVDDQPELLRLYRIAFQGTAFHIVAEAGDGQQGAQLVATHKPDVVVLDLSMPTMDGLESLVAIRRANPDTRVVILSGFGADRMADVCLELGASRYLEKGIRPAQLIAELEKAVLAPPQPFVAPSQEALQKMLRRAAELV